jgi:NAD-dependent DNA ligase
MIDKIVEKLEEANEKYRQGNPIMSDYDYDQLLETLLEYDSQNEYFNKVGHSVSDESRKVKLPIEMASMNKIKSMDDINDWCRLKGISKNEVVIITPKFDGLSLCVNELTEDAFTRGNGEYGQKSNEHYKLIGNKLYEDTDDLMGPIAFTFTYGEVMMSKSTFMKKYSSDFANPRNLVAGLLNSKEAGESLKDCNYIKYGAIPFGVFKDEFKTKEDILNYLNQNQKEEVRNFKCKISELTEDILIELFHNWSIDYEIDGLIIEINDLSLQDKLGRETSSGNPIWARAFKHPSFEQSAETEIIGISWNISKNGLLKPVVHVNPIRLDGVTVSNVTGNNARFVKDMGIGIGAKVVIRRSGMVIPLIVEVLESVEFVMPTIEGVEIGWNDAGIELVTLTETDEQKIKKNIAFFEILEADQLSTGIITQLWDAGFKTIDQILNLTTNDLEKIDRFGKRKAKIVFESIAKSIKDVQLSKLQHATNIFVGMGSKKLALLEHFKEKPTVKQVMSIEGFAEISANIYVDNYDRFFDFIKDLPITIAEKVEVVKTSNDLVDMVVVFTGLRLKEEEKLLELRGAKIGSSVSKNTTHLVCKDPNSGSSKLEKAKSLGIEIMSVDDLNILLKKSN